MIVSFGGKLEEVVKREEFSVEKAREVHKGKTISFIGYGKQGPGQSLNMKDQGFNVIIGQRESYSKKGADEPTSWEKALNDEWVPGKTLFSIEEASSKGDVVAMLISDAAAPKVWPSVKKGLNKGDLLYFSHGMAKVFSGINPPANVDVGMIAPKGAGEGVREMFKKGSGTNSSFALDQDVTGNLRDRVLAMGIGIGSGYLFANTMALEVVEDHHGERNTLLASAGAVADSAYQVARANGMNERDAFIHTSEQLTQVILPIIGAEGAKGIYDRAQASGQTHVVAGMQALIADATVGINSRLYESCSSGKEARISLESNNLPDYRNKLNGELADLNAKEIWSTGFDVRKANSDRTYDREIKNWELAGAMLGLIDSQYACLTGNGHRQSAGFNETVEELTQSLNPFYQRDGVTELIRVCSTTAQRGALDWLPQFEKVISGSWPKSVKGADIPSGYSSTNVWDVGKQVRYLRPENIK